MRGSISIVGLGVVMALGLFFMSSTGCSSIPDITFDDAEGGGGSSGGPCRSTGDEICGDGIDNDCNGRTDCADDACNSRLSCIDRVPADWQVVAFAEGARPPCPDGFGDSTDVRSVQGASGAPSCTCNCSGSSTCANGTVTLALGGDASCSGSTETLDVKSGCKKLSGDEDFDVGANPFLRVTPPPTPSCNGDPTSAPPPLRDSRICKLEAKSSGGCSGSSTCVPRAGDGYEVCIQKAGVNACPSGFASERHAGTGATDTRACSPCTCTASPCAVELKLHDNGNCSSPKVTVTTPGTCTKVSTAAFNARGYETKVSGGCVVANPPHGSGSLSFEGESTVCCRSSGN